MAPRCRFWSQGGWPSRLFRSWSGQGQCTQATACKVAKTGAGVALRGASGGFGISQAKLEKNSFRIFGVESERARYSG